MKAAVRKKYGDETVIEVLDVERPEPGSDEILVRVHATTVNRTDCGVLSGEPFIFRFFTGLPNPREKILGTDFAGEVTAVGDGVTHFSPGDRVFGFYDEGIPSQAEYMAISASKAVAKIPEQVSYESAVASIEGGHYAYNFLKRVVVGKNDEVMVNGGTGAIGSALIQFLKLKGCGITATCRAEHMDQVKALGAGTVIDYTSEDFTEQNKKFPLVLDAVGKSSFWKCKRVMTDKGVYISSELGPHNENPLLALFTPLGGGRKVLFPIPANIRESLEFIADLLAKGEFTPLIDPNYYSLDEIREAYRYVRSASKVGNVILKIRD